MAIAAAFFLLSVGDIGRAADARIHISLNAKSAAGTGNLFFARRRWRLHVGGVDLAKAAIAAIELDGTASNLHHAADVVGTYGAAPSGTGMASVSKAARLVNAHGVVLELHANKELHANNEIAANQAAAPDLNLAGMKIESRGWHAVIRTSRPK